MRELKEDVGIPASLSDIDVPASALEHIIKDAATFRMLGNSPRQLTIDDLRLIVKHAMHIA